MLFFVIFFLISYVNTTRDSDLDKYELISSLKNPDLQMKPYYMQIQQPKNSSGSIYLFQIIFTERVESSLPIAIMSHHKNLKLTDLIFGINNSELNSTKYQSNEIFFDYQSVLSDSNTHLIQVLNSVNTNFYFIFGDLGNQNAQFKFTVNIYTKKTLSNNLQCVNDCQSKKINGFYYVHRACEEGQCMCGSQQFGLYCQFRKKIMMMGSQTTISLKSNQWHYISYKVELDQVNNYSQQIEIDNLINDVVMSFGFSGIVGYDIPSRLTNTYILYKSQYSSTTYSLYTQVKRYSNLITNISNQDNHELYIGFYNPSQTAMQFTIRFQQSYDNNLKKFLSNNYVMLLILSINCVLVIIFYCCRKNNLVPINSQISLPQQPTVEANAVRRIKPQKGFRKEFIQVYFPPYEYCDIMDSYPLLQEQEECVICLEAMRSLISITQRNSIMQSQLDPQIEEYMRCSVTPCFHIFHQQCLARWFIVQKYCPICRELFSESKLRRQKKWIILNRQQVIGNTSERSNRNNQSNYMKRIIKSKQQIPIMLDDESKLNDFQNSNVNFLNVSSLQSFDNSNSISVMIKQVNECEKEEKCQNILDEIDELKQI